MKIPINALIHRDKLTGYLLIPKHQNDKSQFLAKAGFTQENPEVLEAAIRRLISENEALPDRVDEYGTFYQVRGRLQGPNGILLVVTIWLQQQGEQGYRFITLKP